MLNDILKKLPQVEMDKTNRNILLLSILILVVIIVLYVYLFLGPTLKGIFDVFPKIHSRSMDIKLVLNDSEFEGKLKNKQSDLEAKIGKYEKRLSREKEIPMLLESLSKMAKESHVKILSITPGDRSLIRKKQEKKGSVYEEVPIAITAQCGYHDLGTFINRLENDERYMQVSDIAIRSRGTTPKRHDIDFVVYAYTFKGEE